VKIAVIGGGISGMAAAYLLADDHELTLYEANDYIGGHTHTVNVSLDGEIWAVDTGFIVFNEVTYPNFCTLMDRLGVVSQPTRMNFSVRDEKADLEYNSRSLVTIFAQKKNLLSPSYYRMLLEIFRLRRDIRRFLQGPDEKMELIPFLIGKGYSRRFIEHFVVPLVAALWSSDPGQVGRFPFATFARFFQNSGFLAMKNPLEWRVIQGGSERYVEKLTASYRDRIRLNAPVQGVRREENRVVVTPVDGSPESYDHVVIAAHSDQALAMLEDPSEAERDVLGAIPYQENDTLLHTDTRVLPRRQSLWASWNYLIPREESGFSTITYDMNVLQSLSARQEFCVSLNLTPRIDPEKVIERFTYHHPVFLRHSVPAQQDHARISGVNRTHYCGAYWRHRFRRSRR